MRRDVERVLDEPVQTRPPPLTTPGRQRPRRSPPRRCRPTTGFVDEPHSRIRRATAARLTESKRTAPHFYLRATCRVDTLLAMRADLNRTGDGKVSVNDLVVKAAARAHTLGAGDECGVDR